MGFGVFLGYLYIRVITRKEAEQQIHNAVTDYFGKNTSVDLIKSHIAEQTESWSDDITSEMNAITKRVNDLEEKVELIRSSQAIPEDIPTEEQSGSH